MKKILIVIHDMKIGGAQKSLLSFLKGLYESGRADAYEIHLLVSRPGGEFRKGIPAQVKILEPSPELYWLGAPLGLELLRKHFSLRGLTGEIRWILKKRFGRFPEHWNDAQKMWDCWKDLIPAQPEDYDVAVAYIDGYPNYYVMDKVTAKRKVLWFHSEYQKHGYSPEFDAPYMDACDAMVTISEKCRDCLSEAFPEYRDKMHVLENITLSSDVTARSQMDGAEEFDGFSGLKLLTVGRLHPLKGADLAVEAAKALKEAGVSFRWLMVGDGSERERLREMIGNFGLEDCVFLLGSRENPYPYMARCDILVQPSRVEGRSIVLDEAKLLSKPIVVTNYATVRDAVVHGETGWIVEISGQGICDGIRTVAENTALREHMVACVQALHRGNEEEVTRYVEIMFR